VPLPEVHRRICDWLLDQARREVNKRERITQFRPLLN